MTPIRTAALGAALLLSLPAVCPAQTAGDDAVAARREEVLRERREQRLNEIRAAQEGERRRGSRRVPDGQNYARGIDEELSGRRSQSIVPRNNRSQLVPQY
jgi:hypothetical protein